MLPANGSYISLGLRIKVSNMIGTSGSGEPDSKQHLKDRPKAAGTWQATMTFHWLVGGHPAEEDDGSQVMGDDGCGVERKVGIRT